jgi:N-methylhydantoinase A
MNEPNIITTDMGGTSFDVGVIHDGRAVVSYKSLVHQYEYFLPKVDVQTMGTGGGSKVWIDKTTKSLRVGPQSAGATPGPICYGRGGEIPTTTDADVVLGYLDAENFAGGTMQLDREGATRGLQKLADELGMGLYELASGVAQIAEFQMADLVRKATIQKGLDPRDFVLFAFGGAGPVHMAVSAREAGIKRVVVPQGDTASTWCAFGAASADTLHVNEQVRIMSSPFNVDSINGVLAELAAKGRAQLAEDGIPVAQQTFHCSLDMRHRGQINEVEVGIDSEQLTTEDLEDLRGRFVRRYEQLYGHGASLLGARLECVTFRVRASAVSRKPSLIAATELTAEVPAGAKTGERSIYWAEWKKAAPSPIYNGYALLPGNAIDGPCVIETTTTSIVVHPGQRVAVDALRNFVIDTDAQAAV